MQMQATPARTAASSDAADVIVCHAPATRERLGEIPVDGPDAVRAAVARARAAQEQWRHTSFAQRRRVLRHILDEVLARADELCALVVRDSGKTYENAMAGEIWPVCEKLRWTIKNGEKYLRPERMPSDMLVHKTATIEYHPLGVMGAIIPWNYPLQNIMNPAIPALMAGNGIVIKPSEWVAWSSAQFHGIFARALAAEGQSPDLVQLVQGYGATGKALVEGGVDAVCFIGSAANGRRVVEASATNLIPVVMELGGKDPLIVCDDADLMQAVHAAVNGTFINCGQNCVSSERIIVFDGIYDDFERQVVALARGLRQGAPALGGGVDVGAMITPLQLQVVERLVQRALAEGARLLCGASAVLRERGDFFAPTVLADCRPDMEIMQEEVFGPVMLLSRVRGEDQAVELANATRFGLSSSVFSKDHGRAKRIADRLQAGSTTINDFGLIYMAQELPFGGVKQSGFGRMNGRDGLRACTNQKGVVADRWPLHFANQLFPVAPRTYATMRSAIRVIYGDGVLGRAKAAAEAVRALVTGSR